MSLLSLLSKMSRMLRCLAVATLSLLPLADFGWGQEPASAPGAFERGAELYRKRQFQAALPELSRAAEAEPNRAEAHYLRGYCHYVLKQYQAAVDSFGRAFAADPNFDPRTIFHKPTRPQTPAAP